MQLLCMVLVLPSSKEVVRLLPSLFTEYKIIELQFLMSPFNSGPVNVMEETTKESLARLVVAALKGLLCNFLMIFQLC